MRDRKAEVHIKDMVNVVDTDGKICVLSLGYKVGYLISVVIILQLL